MPPVHHPNRACEPKEIAADAVVRAGGTAAREVAARTGGARTRMQGVLGWGGAHCERGLLGGWIGRGRLGFGEGGELEK